MPVVSSPMDLLEKPLLYTKLGMVSFFAPVLKSGSTDGHLSKKALGQ